MNPLQRWWWPRQGLDRPRSSTVAEAVAGTGWLRSVGSANPYSAIRARTGAGRAEVERAVETVEIVELPAARGCTYYVAREDAALALRTASNGSYRAEFRMAERHLGVTEEEVRLLADAIERALEGGALDPRALSANVSPRNLGDEGKKRGMTSILSLGLSRLQIEGRIRRIPHGGRLDTERYRYAIWNDGPKPFEIDAESAAYELAQRYFAWAGPASEGEFREFTGLSAKAARAAMADLLPCPADPTRCMRPDDVEAFEACGVDDERVVLLSSLDPWLHSRRSLPSLLDPLDVDMTLPFGAEMKDATGLRDADSHLIVMGGVLVGLWEFDHERQEIAAWIWRRCHAIDEAVENTGRWIAEELGDFRSFTLDSPKSRVPRIERLRSLAAAVGEV